MFFFFQSHSIEEKEREKERKNYCNDAIDNLQIINLV